MQQVSCCICRDGLHGPLATTSQGNRATSDWLSMLAGLAVILCTCSDKELLYFLEMRFLMVSFTDFTFFPREIRDVLGDLMTSRYSALSLVWGGGERERERCVKSESPLDQKPKLNKPLHSIKTTTERETLVSNWLMKVRWVELTLDSLAVLTTCRALLDRSNPPKLHVLWKTVSQSVRTN